MKKIKNAPAVAKPATARKRKPKPNHNRKYFLFLIAAFAFLGFAGWQFSADADPARAPAKKAHVNYVEIKQAK